MAYVCGAASVCVVRSRRSYGKIKALVLKEAGVVSGLFSFFGEISKDARERDNFAPKKNIFSQSSCAEEKLVHYLALWNAGWSSPVARQAHNLKVLGSNPSPATSFAQLGRFKIKRLAGPLKIVSFPAQPKAQGNPRQR
jgi:hypothetical protein